VDLEHLIQQHLDKHMPAGIAVPDGLSEDEAIESVKQQLAKVGQCSDDLARQIVQEAYRRRDAGSAGPPPTSVKD
jgi:hypothetical protein